MIKFIIIMATFFRSNSQTKKLLQRTLNTILYQTYTVWDLIIVGDKYEPIDELTNIIADYRNELDTMNRDNKIIMIDNQITERDYVEDKKKLWSCAGATSMNEGLKYARDNGYIYYCHIDDDDMWLNTHLQVLANIYTQYPMCIFAHTKASYGKSTIPAPSESTVCTIYKNNRMPIPGTIAHSSISFRIDIMNFNYYTNLTGIGTYIPSDACMLSLIKDFLEKNLQYCSVYVPHITCKHTEEATIYV